MTGVCFPSPVAGAIALKDYTLENSKFGWAPLWLLCFAGKAFMGHDSISKNRRRKAHATLLSSTCFYCCCKVTSVMPDSVRPHRWHPTKLPCPRDSPSENTGVGCHFLLNAQKWKVKVKSLSHVWLFDTPWIAAHQAPPFMGFSKQECWSELPLPSPPLHANHPESPTLNPTTSCPEHG